MSKKMSNTNKSKAKSYSYSTLSSVRLNSKVNVYGVVKFLKQPYKSRGSDYCMLITLVDDSFKEEDESLKCLLFAKKEDLLPLAELGDIVRFHRLTINGFRGSLQGQSSPGYSWLLWSGDTEASLDPIKSSSPHYQVTEEDKEKVSRLRQWRRGKQEFVKQLSSFHEVGAKCYFDLLCQVVSVAVLDPNVCTLLRVWDGTRSIYKVKTVEKTFEDDEISTDLLLEEMSEDLMYDVLVYDNHTLTAGKVKPGDFVKFTNLHASECKTKEGENNPSGVPMIEFFLHRGDSYGRGIRVLSPDFPDLKGLKERLEKLSAPNLSSDTEFMNQVCGEQEVRSGSSDRAGGERAVGSLDRNAGEQIIADSGSYSGLNNRTAKRKSEHLNTWEERSESVLDLEMNSKSGSAEGEDSVVVVDKGGMCKDSDSDPRCMLQTKTVILNHPHVKKCKIESVLANNEPGKFRVCAQILAYHPAASQVNTFLKLYCKICRYLCDIPTKNGKSSKRRDLELEVGSTFRDVPHFMCPKCAANKDSLSDLDSPPNLSYIYMMRFILQDDTGIVMANLWRSEAVEFFKGIEPEDIINSTGGFSRLQELLTDICPTEIAVDKPWIECCLRSYTVNGVKHTQIFDTAIV